MQPADRTKGEIALAWFALVLWIALIQALSSNAISAKQTFGVLGSVLRWLLPDADTDFIWTVNIAIRKTAHFLEYAVLGLLALHAFALSFDRPPKWLAAASLLLALAVASVDEIRQAATADRTGRLADVALDVTGAASALALASAVRRCGSART